MRDDLATGATPPDRVQLHGEGYVAEAGWFGPEDRPRFGWLYRPDRPTGDVGIVIVPPFGREEICAHRTVRHLAERSAREGFRVLRFDLDGTGDSAGDDTEPGRMDAWVTSVVDACNVICGTGETRVVLVGIRLGATLAALAAPKCQRIAALIAFNAVIRGNAYLRELRAFQAAMNLAPPPSPSSQQHDGQETSGFVLNDEACAAINGISLTRVAPPAPVVWVLERDDMPARRQWTEHLRAEGADVTDRQIAGYSRMMDDPHANLVADELIANCLECARSISAAGAPAPAAPNAAPTPLRPRIRLEVAGISIIEQVVAPRDGMFGIIDWPCGAAARRAVLMLNSGAIRHIGSNRTDVRLARQLASQGTQALRVDLTGIGDSQPRHDAEENIVYSPNALTDVATSVAALRALGARHVTVGGMCSGGYHALRAAIAGQPIDTVYAVNCSVFSRHVDFDPQNSRLLGEVAHYRHSAKSGHAWRKLLTGRVAFSSIARVMLWHVRNHGRRLWRELARHLHLPLRDDLGAHLRRLARQGIRVNFIYAADEPGLSLLAAEAGSIVPRLMRAGWVRKTVFVNTNHTFTQRWAQATLHGALMELLSTHPEGDHGESTT